MGIFMIVRIANKQAGRVSLVRSIRNCVLLGVLLLVALLVGPSLLYAQSYRQTSASPEDRVSIFYKWVIGTMIKKRSPVRQKKVVSTFLSKSLYRWLYMSADAETRNLYLLPGNDWSESWIDKIKIVHKKNAANRAMIRLGLGENKPPDQFVDPIQVNLIREGGTWKIDCIQSADEELGIPKFDPKYDPPGCKPV